jgi:hypothetical protein
MVGFLRLFVICREPVPDRGFYTPNRVNDNFIGLSSSQQVEDILFICDRKTEVSCRHACLNDNPFKSILMMQILGLLMQHVKACRNNATLTTTFNNTIRLRAGVEPSLVRIPAQEVVFVQGQSTPRQAAGARNGPANGARNGPASGRGGVSNAAAGVTLPIVLTNPEFRGEIAGTRLTVSAEPGLAQDVVEERRKRQQQRQKRAEARRKQAEVERKERNAVREKERERERLIRLQEKKARKKAEKEAKRRAREIANGVSVDGSNASKKGGRPTPPPRSYTPDSSSTDGEAVNSSRAVNIGGKSQSFSNQPPPPPPGNRPAPPPRSKTPDSAETEAPSSRTVNVGNGKSQSFSAAPVAAVPIAGGNGIRKGSPRAGNAVPAAAGGANNELAAAMARRRAANNEA